MKYILNKRIKKKKREEKKGHLSIQEVYIRDKEQSSAKITVVH